MKVEPGDMAWCASLRREVYVIGINSCHGPSSYLVRSNNGFEFSVLRTDLYKVSKKQVTAKKNPWKKFAHNGDEPPADLSLGFSRFVIGKGKDGVKLPVVFDHQGATWYTPRIVEATEGNQGETWEEVEIIEWREL
jgi:hypothetical protein